jgi:hypothetical protein
MNERIRELEAQCWEPTQYGPAWFNSTKFAELIVRECADVCRDDGRWFQEQDDKVEAGVAYALAYKIEETFRS